MFALISHARTGTPGKLRPFLFVQVQLWMRELRRLVAKVDRDEITYAIAHDLNRLLHFKALTGVKPTVSGDVANHKYW